jgi:hypothetical protein
MAAKVNKSSGRAKPMTPKAGVTKNRSRRYDCGGKLKNK